MILNIFFAANGSLRPYIPVCPDSHSVALRLHLPLFPCGLFPGFSSSLSLPSVVFPSPYGFLAGLMLALKFRDSRDFVAFPVLRLGDFSNSKDFPAIAFAGFRFRFLFAANGFLRSCIPACPDSHCIALRLHLPLFPCGLLLFL
jgi:hypothetical protein